MPPITSTPLSSLTNLNLLTTGTGTGAISITSPASTTTSLTTHALQPRSSNSINATPLIVIPLLCTAIFALIINYTIRQEREYQDDVTQGRRAARSVSSWESTGAWVRDVGDANPRKATRKGRGGKARGRKTDSSVSVSTSGDVSEKHGKARGRRLSTVEEESEADGQTARRAEVESVIEKPTQAHIAGGRSPRRSSRRERGEGSSKKGQLKGGRRPSSTIREV